MGRVEFNVSRFERKQGVVFADADRLAWVEGRTALSDDDLARENVLVCRTLSADDTPSTLYSGSRGEAQAVMLDIGRGLLAFVLD